jgi:hypothetical protein
VPDGRRIAFVLTLALVATAPGQTAGDRFLCYRVRDVTTPRPTPIPAVTLADEFDTGSAEVTKPTALCPPAAVNGGGVVDPATHVKGYKIKPVFRHRRRAGLQVANEFGSVQLDTIRPDRLLVPAAKQLAADPPPPGANDVDDYACYRVTPSAGRRSFVPIPGVGLSDQFETRTVDLVKPRRLCVPVALNGGTVKNPGRDLLCYQARLADGESPHEPRRGLHVNDVFGLERLDTVREDDVCVPASHTVLTVRGCYDHDSSATGWDHIVAAGFTVVDMGPYRSELDALPAGVKGWVWLGDYDNTTCAWEQSDDWIRSHVGAVAGDPKIAGYFLADEPHVWDCPSAPDDVRTRAALVKSIDAGPPTFVVLEPHSPGNPYAPYVGTVDVIAADPYPCSYTNGCRMTKIDDEIALLEAAGAPRYWGVVGVFADAYYRYPTPDELREEFARWRASRMDGYLVFAWSYAGNSLEDHPDLVDVLQEENGS